MASFKNWSLDTELVSPSLLPLQVFRNGLFVHKLYYNFRNSTILSLQHVSANYTSCKCFFTCFTRKFLFCFLMFEWTSENVFMIVFSKHGFTTIWANLSVNCQILFLMSIFRLTTSEYTLLDFAFISIFYLYFYLKGKERTC